MCEEQPGAQKLGKEDKCMHVWSVCITERERERERERDPPHLRRRGSVGWTFRQGDGFGKANPRLLEELTIGVSYLCFKGRRPKVCI